jgi:hypothetical protein
MTSTRRISIFPQRSASFMDELFSGRRELLIAPLLAALPLALASEPARADKLNPDWTIVRRPNEIKWQSQAEFS